MPGTGSGRASARAPAYHRKTAQSDGADRSWGELCVTSELASLWADNLIDLLRASWRDHRTSSYFQGTPVCLSSLLAAGRYQELLDLLEKAPSIWWEYRRWGVQALAAHGQGRRGAALC
jgi:hypothetical protein